MRNVGISGIFLGFSGLRLLWDLWDFCWILEILKIVPGFSRRENPIKIRQIIISNRKYYLYSRFEQKLFL
jgi:hypothetical protein